MRRIVRVGEVFGNGKNARNAEEMVFAECGKRYRLVGGEQSGKAHGFFVGKQRRRCRVEYERVFCVEKSRRGRENRCVGAFFIGRIHEEEEFDVDRTFLVMFKFDSKIFNRVVRTYRHG